MTEILRHALEYAAIKCAPRNDRSIAPFQMDRVQDLTLTYNIPVENVREANRPGAIVGRGTRMPDAGATLSWLEHGAIAPYAILAGLDPTTTTSVELADLRPAHYDLLLPCKKDSGAMLRSDYLLNAYLTGLTVDARAPDGNVAVDAGMDASYLLSALSPNPYLIVYEHTVTEGEETAGSFEIDGDYPVPVVFDTVAGGHVINAHYIDGDGDTNEAEEDTDFTMTDDDRTVTSDLLTEGDVWVLHYVGATLPSGVDDAFDALNDDDAAEIPATQLELCLVISGSDTILSRIESARINLTQTRERLAQIGDRFAYGRGLTDEGITVELGRVDTDHRLLTQLQNGDPDTKKVLDILDGLLTGVDFELRIYDSVAKDSLLLRHIVSDVFPQAGDLRAGGVLNSIRSGTTLQGTDYRVTTLAVGS